MKTITLNGITKQNKWTVLFFKRTISFTIKFCHIVPFSASLKPWPYSAAFPSKGHPIFK